MAERLWNQIDMMVEPKPYHLENGDICFYVREYISHGGFQSSEANQLITNFKKSPDRKDKPEWHYKVKAIKQFAYELEKSLPEDICIATIPTSKPRNDAEFDDRFDVMLKKLGINRPDIIIEEPIIRTERCKALHAGGRRKVADVLKTLAWRGFKTTPKMILLIDDVLTCGTNFKACQQLIVRNAPGVEVAGLFWAKTTWSEDDVAE